MLFRSGGKGKRKPKEGRVGGCSGSLRACRREQDSPRVGACCGMDASQAEQQETQRAEREQDDG